ncbi:acyltransferase family protein [Aeromicrobium sp.]|uniref:acyltransferase family protein n=1 Tax=Aeromicrobium sp. TaxID=1871063 RepID=UPI003D6BEE3A
MVDVQHHDVHVESLRRSTTGRDVRLDIEGLRAIAIGTVLAFHAGLPWVGGGFIGVDVFFVLSGFLITDLLVREVTQSGRVRLGRFWARRARRLLPASAVVLAFSVLVTWIWLPLTQRSVFGGDIVSSALYVVNWRLADRSVDYQAEDVVASPVQHFWSLAVEEQFYVIWPLLILAVAVIFARRRVLGALLALTTITLVSFAYSVQQAESSPDTAFFVSTTRIWELGVGALLALAATHVARAPRALRVAVGWVGLAAIVWAALQFEATTSWPGWPALLPVLGAAGVIASGIGPSAAGPARLLSLWPMVWVGGLSYSLYLWHWPILVAGEAAIDDFRIRHGVALTLIAFVPAWLSRRYVEDPIRFGPRFRPTRRALGLGAALTATGVVIGLSLSASTALTDTVKEASAQEALGARAIDDPARGDFVWSSLEQVDRMVPLPADASEDVPAYTERDGCRVTFDESEPKLCTFGDATADRVVVLVGSSKIAQWQGGFDAIAKREGWKLVQMFKFGCDFTDAMLVRKDQRWTPCRDWGRAALKQILRLDPGLVITTAQKKTALPDDRSDPTDLTRPAMVDGLASYWDTITDAGIPMATLLDNPEPSPAVSPVYECVAQNQDDLRRCVFDRGKGFVKSGGPTQLAAAEKVPAVEVMDMADVICPDGPRCAPVIGNVLVYRQGTHITNTFVLSAQKQLAAALSNATDGRFGSG